MCKAFLIIQDTWKCLLPPAYARKFITICEIKVLTNAYLGVDKNLVSRALGASLRLPRLGKRKKSTRRSLTCCATNITSR